MALDDDPAIGSFMAAVAGREGFTVEVVRTAEAFRTALRTTPADVVTVDLLMPGTDGVEVLRDLARLEPAPEVVLVSGLDDRATEGARRVAADFGLTIRGQVQKPFRASELRDVLATPAAGPGAGSAPPHAPTAVPAAIPAPRRLAVTREDLRRAIVRGELVLQYQPQLSLMTGDWLGAEALVRWQHPTQGLLQPAAFLGLVDDEPLASELTMSVLRTAAAEWSELNLELGRELALSVNVHPLALSAPGFAAGVRGAVVGAGLRPEHVVLEITEVAPIGRGIAVGTLTSLRMRGFELSIDDFGTGHSNLERLAQVPFSELKVDRGLVAELRRDDVSRTIATQVVDLARELHLRSVAEGIEDQMTMGWLRKTGCDMGQGFEISRPAWACDLAAWSRHWNAA